jgi:hypothetical protein
MSHAAVQVGRAGRWLRIAAVVAVAVTMVGRPSSRTAVGSASSSESSSSSTMASRLLRVLSALGKRPGGLDEPIHGGATVHFTSSSLHLRHGNPSTKRRAYQQVGSRRDNSDAPSHLTLRIRQGPHEPRGENDISLSKTLRLPQVRARSSGCWPSCCSVRWACCSVCWARSSCGEGSRTSLHSSLFSMFGMCPDDFRPEDATTT